MNKYLYTIIVSVVIFSILMAMLFLEPQFSNLEKTFFNLIFSIAVGYLLYLKLNTEEQIQRLHKAKKVSKVGFWSLDLTKNTLFWSEEIFDIFEINPKEFKPSYESFLNTIHPDDRELVNNAYTKSLEDKEHYVITHRLLMNDGRIKWVKEECETEFDKNDNPLLSIGTVADITKEMEYLNKIELQTYTDDLTKLYNRKYYNEKIKKLLSLKKRYQTPFSMIIYDIDDFKYINDTYGHKIGDTVLIRMSELIKSHLRESDYIFRVGGEEFVILLTETRLEDAKKVSSKICKNVKENLKNITDNEITISIGVSEVNESDNEDTIFKRVDKLLYKSKYNGKNRISY